VSRVPPAAAPGQQRPRTPQQAAFTLRWRATWVTEVIRVSLLVIIGLTPAGVAFMRLLAPSGYWVPVAAALMIMAAALAAAGLLATHPTPAVRLQRLADLAFAGLPGVRPSWRT
jgi:hypothetical protein